ncbi:MAG: hypothetical protein LBP87_05690 [Planctomycetaceae bacterium]|jgi:hypothetical protein|nr:hypothetical protein [Planctomycetaceae bacterium]
MLVEQNGHLVPYQRLHKKVLCLERCFAESHEKRLLLHEYRRRIERGMGIFEEIPKGEPSFDEVDESILKDKKFRSAVLSFIRKTKGASLSQIKRHVKSKYTSVTLCYFFDWCIANNLLFMREVFHQNKRKTCYYYIR